MCNQNYFNYIYVKIRVVLYKAYRIPYSYTFVLTTSKSASVSSGVVCFCFKKKYIYNTIHSKQGSFKQVIFYTRLGVICSFLLLKQSNSLLTGNRSLIMMLCFLTALPLLVTESKMFTICVYYSHSLWIINTFYLACPVIVLGVLPFRCFVSLYVIVVLTSAILIFPY